MGNYFRLSFHLFIQLQQQQQQHRNDGSFLTHTQMKKNTQQRTKKNESRKKAKDRERQF